MRQVTGLTGLSAKQISYFDATGVLIPEISGAHGKGTRRIYSYRDVVALRMVATLRSGGVSLQAIRKAIEFIRSVDDTHLAGLLLINVGGDVLLAASNELMVSLLRQPKQLYFVLDLGGVVEEVDAAIKAVS